MSHVYLFGSEAQKQQWLPALGSGEKMAFAITEPDAVSAIRLTLIAALVAVPLNLVFGIAAAWAIARFRFPGRTVLTVKLSGRGSDSAARARVLASWTLLEELAQAHTRRLARTLDDLTLQAWTGVGLGRAYFTLGQYRLGIERTRFLVAIDSRTPLDVSAPLAMLLPSVGSRTWLALCLTRIGEYGEASGVAEDAVAAAERADNAQARVWAYYTLAHIHLTRGEPAPALARLERALALCGHGEEPLYYPRVLGALGSAHALEGRPDQAVELLEHAAAESRAIRLRYGYAGLLTSLGDACLGAGHFDEASRLAAEAVALTRERGERGDEGWAVHLKAEIAARRGPPDAAEAAAAYREALAIAEGLEMRPLAARCRLGLGALLGSAGEVLEARAQLERASELFAALGSARWQREAEELSAKIAR
jgi:tetratricopeptide (TPR) repeat protein